MKKKSKSKSKSKLRKAGKFLLKGAGYYVAFSALIFVVFAIITAGVAVAASSRKSNGAVGAAGTAKAKKQAPNPRQVNAQFAAKMQRVLAELESDNVVLRSHYAKANANEKEAIEQKLAKNANKAKDLKKLIPETDDE